MRARYNHHMDDQTEPAAADPAPSAPRLTMRLVAHDVAKHFFDVESGWLRTVRELTLAPGAMIRRYVQGHRKVYTNPVAYLVLATAMSVVIQNLVGFHDRMVTIAQSNTLDSPLQMEFVNRFTELVFQYSLYLSIGLLVPMALLVRVFFRRSGYNLAESFVFALYSGGHTALLSVVLVPLYMLLPPSAAIQGIVAVAVAVIYTMYAARGFFSGSLLSVAIKAGVAYVMAYFVFMAVMMACIMAYIFIVLVPTASGVDWDLVTATDYEAIPVVEKLLDQDADVNMTLQRTALHAAAEHGNLEIVELLIERGADVNLQDIHGRVPMVVALAEHHPDVARYLAEAGTNPHIRANDGSTLLLAAARARDVELVQWALDHGVDVNATRPKKTSTTALMMAARKGDAEIVQLLLASGADPTVANHEGQTALDVAKGKDVKKLLQAVATRQPTPVPEGTE